MGIGEFVPRQSYNSAKQKHRIRALLDDMYDDTVLLPHEVYVHNMLCDCAVCAEFFKEVDASIPDTCWVTGDQITWKKWL